MNGEFTKGIVIAGNILVDFVKDIDCYPEKGMLVNISQVVQSVGGCVPNTAINLAKIDPKIPIKALGKVGDDDCGKYVICKMKEQGILTDDVLVSADAPTSFTDVMSQPSGERTFFHARGANKQFSPQDINIENLNCDILHIGYILLLDKFDANDLEYGTVMARFLEKVQKCGIKTSIDMVSDSGANYKEKILPALKYCDYVIINEIECCNIYGLNPRTKEGRLDIDNIKKCVINMSRGGVSEKIIIHSKEAGLCYDVKSGVFTVVPSLEIPPDKIKGSVGAGDSFCAGCLYGIYNNFSDDSILKFASAAAACNLFEANSVHGMKCKDEILELEERYGRIE